MVRLVIPPALTCIHRISERTEKRSMFVTLAYCFSFDRPNAVLSASAMWRMVVTDLGRDGVLDHWMPKPQAEVIVSGACFPGEPTQLSYVRLRVGSSGRTLIDKRLAVFGDRRWTPAGPSAPETFLSMPIDYRHAFGGPGHPSNPRGKGFSETPDRMAFTPLPNVEDPRHPLEACGDTPPPATLAGRDPTLVRVDGKPLLNLAPSDQRVRGFFEGDEELTIENMHPGKRSLEIRLPGFRARCFARYGSKPKLTELRLRLDTIRLFPHHERAIVCFRGETELVTRDGVELDTLLGALDDPGEHQRPIDHFESFLATRSNGAAPQVVVAGPELMPQSHAPMAADSSPDSNATREHEVAAAARAAQVEIRAITERLLAGGLDPDLIPDLASFGRGHAVVDARSLKATAREEHTVRMRAMADLGAPHTADSELDPIDPPRFSASAEIERIEAIIASGSLTGVRLSSVRRRLADPGFRASLLEVERTLHLRYRLLAHLGKPPGRTSRAKSNLPTAGLRLLVAEAKRGKRDFTGLDLSGEDLSGLDLEGAFLERADLRGTNLSRANLRHAVLAHARLEGASLAGANLEGANLGRVAARRAVFRGAKLAGAILYGADLEMSDLGEADLRGAGVSDVNLSKANLTGAIAERVVFRTTNFASASLRGARVARCVFIECAASGLDCTGADLSLAIFRRSVADLAIFRDALAGDIRIEDSSFKEADFGGATLADATLRGAILEKARFGGANLRRSDLSGADLRGADLTDAIATECLALGTDLSGAFLAGANLMLAILHGANLRGTDLTRANLFCADLTATISDEKTRLAGSNVKRALLAGVHHD